MKWFIQAPLEILASIIAYITNPIVVLFADEYGWLPDIFKWWQTYDNTLDVEWMLTEDCVPSFAKYDYSKHYVYHYEDKGDDYVIPGYVDLIDDNFTSKERFQRYICRLCWLYRNTNYGFSYFVNGRYTKKEDLIVIKKVKTDYEEQFLGYVPDGLFNTTWCIYYEKPWCKKFKLRVYLGWKLKSVSTGTHMLALFVHPFRKVK